MELQLFSIFRATYEEEWQCRQRGKSEADKAQTQLNPLLAPRVFFVRCRKFAMKLFLSNRLHAIEPFRMTSETQILAQEIGVRKYCQDRETSDELLYAE